MAGDNEYWAEKYWNDEYWNPYFWPKYVEPVGLEVMRGSVGIVERVSGFSQKVALVTGSADIVKTVRGRSILR